MCHLQGYPIIALMASLFVEKLPQSALLALEKLFSIIFIVKKSNHNHVTLWEKEVLQSFDCYATGYSCHYKSAEHQIHA
jgi:hypothetical protein